MPNAYTPGLTVSADIVVRRIRRLPIKGEVLAPQGSDVNPDTVIARAMLPGNLQTFKLAEKMGIDAHDIATLSPIKVGQSLKAGEHIYETKGLFGMFKQQIISEHTGTVESISEVTGNALIREPSIPIEINAYVKGTLVEIMPQEGGIVEARCAMIQGIFGVGGERTGFIRVATKSSSELLEASMILDTDAGKILVGGSGVSYEAIGKASSIGVKGIIVGGLRDSDLTQFLGYEIGVAITGSEAINLTIFVTEGFGYLSMADRTFKLLQSLEGKEASINGATQIRAGVIRPELLVPLSTDARAQSVASQVFELVNGAPIRIIREPYFGKLGSVTGLPSQLVKLESGTEVRVLTAKLASGEEVTVPRANVEIIAT